VAFAGSQGPGCLLPQLNSCKQVRSPENASVSIRARQVLLFLLCCAFVGQTWLVYSDPIGREDSLSPDAREGQAIWRENNCQSCHQLYGYGGFLGPDLTNTIKNLSPARISAILSEGLGQMPAFGLDAEEQRKVVLFLEGMDATGVSQPRLGEVVAPQDLLRQLIKTAEPMAPEVARGAELVLLQACISCHLPNGESAHRSTDLTLLTQNLSQEQVHTILRDGIEGTAMPRLSMSREDSAAVWAFLLWMNECGEEIRGRFNNLATSKELDLSRLPWFEYE
jgi:nitric oxide reductase subunit C